MVVVGDGGLRGRHQLKPNERRRLILVARSFKLEARKTRNNKEELKSRSLWFAIVAAVSHFRFPVSDADGQPASKQLLMRL